MDTSRNPFLQLDSKENIRIIYTPGVFIKRNGDLPKNLRHIAQDKTLSIRVNLDDLRPISGVWMFSEQAVGDP
jgi:hypothetical protein